jgi:SAM-dependent methyltransferase
VAEASAPLAGRYSAGDLSVFTGPERDRFLGPHGVDGMKALHGDEDAWRRIEPYVVWELLYRREPDLYERLIAGERIHPGILDWLPARIERCVEVAAGTGRLTADLQPRCAELIAVEPAKPLRRLLAAKKDLRKVDVRSGFFDAIPVEDDWADVVISLSSLTRDEWHGGDAGLAEMERVARGMIVLVWPSDIDWLRERGFEYVCFDGDMAVEFRSLQEAVTLAKIFYPHAAGEITGPSVSYDVLGMNAPRDLAWKRVR